MRELGVYLQNHWAAATGGVDLAHRVADTHADTDMGAELQAIAGEVVEDREALRALMARLDLDPGTVGPAIARLAERIGRLKPNGHVLRRSPVSDLLEVEALRAAVSGKRAGWDTLLVLGPDADPVPDTEVRRLRDRADDQLVRLTAVHAALVRRSLRPAV
jgi:hypothetical protein